MIEIKNIRRAEEGEVSRVYADVYIPEKAAKEWVKFSERQEKGKKDYSYLTRDYEKWVKEPKEVYYQVPKSMGEFLVTETADSFVVGFIFYAMVTGQDLVCEAPVSQELLENLNNTLLPLVCRASNLPTIRIQAEVYKEVLGEGIEIGTGMSGGIDSFHVLYQYGINNPDCQQKLTCLTQLDVGAERYYFEHKDNLEQLQDTMIKFTQIKRYRIANAQKVADEVGLKLLQVESNISDIYQGMFECSHIYRSASAILAIQKLIKKYYIASSGCWYFDYCPTVETDPAYYEQISVPLLSTQTTKIISADKAYTRIDKVNDLRNFELAKHHLLVCGKDTKPCYCCGKERRTFVILDILHCQEDFKDIFDQEKVEQVKVDTYFWLLREKESKNPSTYYIYLKAKEMKLIPAKSKMKYCLWKMKKMVWK